MSTKIYEYSKCTTCVKALKFLDTKKIKYEKLPIVDSPPPVADLKKMLVYLKADGHDFKKLFNTSGIQYRELKMAEQIKNGLTEAEALKLLSGNGKLIKRPFLLTDKFGTVGFNEDLWKKLF
jgi:arsenate reductase (glutaredoxin)